MKWTRLFLLCVALVGVPVSIAQQSLAASAGWTPELMLKLKHVGDVQVSPNGKLVAFTVTEQVMGAGTSEPRTHIWLARADGSESFQFTRGDKSCTHPRWSPDGNWIGFLSGRSGYENIWLIRASGGEAEPLTSGKQGISSFEWSHDGKSIAFIAPLDTSAEEERNAKEKTDWRVVDGAYRFNRLWVVPVQPDAEGERMPRLLTKQDFHLGAGFRQGMIHWSPDDRKIVFDHIPTPRIDDWPKLSISEVDVETGALRQSVPTPVAEAPVYSPDGRWIAYMATDLPLHWAESRRLYVVPAAGGEPRKLASTFDLQPAILGWAADSRSLIVEEARGTTGALYRVPLNGNATEIYRPEEGSFSGATLNRTGHWMGMVVQSTSAAPEAFVTSLDHLAPVPVSQVNAGLPKLPLGRTEVIQWKAADGLDIEGLLTYPVGYQPGKRYPLLLIIHGGPTGVFTQSFIADPGHYPIAVFAARGYAVLQGNPRGSSGYGRDFRWGNYNDWGGKDYGDLMGGVDRVIAIGVADPDRLGVMGWSYGGFMTSWVITQTRRFKAASIGAPITDLASFNGPSDITGFVPNYFGGDSWEIPEAYLKHSPVYNAKGVTTPALIQQGSADPRVPLGQGLEFYNALVRQGGTARMEIYPRSAHSPREPKQILHIMQSNLDWFEKYIGGAGPG